MAFKKQRMGRKKVCYCQVPADAGDRHQACASDGSAALCSGLVQNRYRSPEQSGLFFVHPEGKGSVSGILFRVLTVTGLNFAAMTLSRPGRLSVRK